MPATLEVLERERAAEQRASALSRANYVKRERYRLKLAIASGRQSLEDVLLEPPEWLARARVADVMRAAPRYGPSTVRTMLARCGISHGNKIGGLTERQRDVLVAAVRARQGH